jgi:prolyl-tRNA editing enzyme YbaK/EbsC (Cys-tRNA(Pro) deacylase)
MVPGDRRASASKVAKLVGCRKARVAGAELVRDVTGFEPGAVAPFPLPRVDRIFVDRGLLRYDRVWVGAGSPRHLAGLPSSELLRLARAQPMDAVQDGA